MGETRYSYEGNPFHNIIITPKHYVPEFFNLQIELESDVFYEIRKYNNITPYRLNQCTQNELDDIKEYFNNNKSSFFFLFSGKELIGSILIIRNQIKSLSVARKYQRHNYGTKLTQYAVNFILSKGYLSVELIVLDGNIPAHNLYNKIGFKEINV